jgi:bacteriorhodopsin
MTTYLPSWKGWRAVLLTIVTGFVLPPMTSVRTGHASNPASIQVWVVAAFFVIACGICIFFAWRRGRRSDRVAALVALGLTIWLIVGFINAVT